MIRKFKLTEIPVKNAYEASPVRIVADGTISTFDVGDGRMLPVIILDASQRLDIREYILLHQGRDPGDVLVRWGRMLGHADTVMLFLAFERPAEMNVIIAFDLHLNHGALVDQILRMNGMYIQAGVEGDRLKNTLDAPKVILEIPDTGFGPTWDKWYLDFTVRKLIRSGLKRRHARIAGQEAIAMLRKLGQFRISSD
jgi:hypothetical protein